MNASVAVAVLEPIGQGQVVLEKVEVDAVLRGLCSETTLTQSYRNLESLPIEVVYSFPLPLDAVLLELTLELNGETLTGKVTAKAEAEEAYEEAIEEGDSAVLLRQLEPGLYSLSLGNLMAGERALIRYRYSQLHQWQGDSLRFQLPTTVAPRYGDPLKAGLQPHEVPEYSLSVDRGFAISLRVEGVLSQSGFECPSHPLAVSQEGSVRVFRLSGGSALMDRDFVLIFKAAAAATGQAYWCLDRQASEDKGRYLVLASFHPDYPGELPPLHRTFKLVLDCSGSMGGDSMRQAKQAVREIFASLTPDDHFSLTAFGSNYQLLFPRPRPASDKNLVVARRFVEQIDANMGGTEIRDALMASYRAGAQGQSDRDIDLLLITDGKVWNDEVIIQEAKASNHRIFTVGVGSAVSEGFVRRIAEVTGGACELVSPREQMAEHILRHFHRIRQPIAQTLDIHWPSPARRQFPKRIEGFHAGDTLHLYAWLKAEPRGEVVLRISYLDGLIQEQRLPLQPAEDGFAQDLPRLAVSARLPSLKPKQARKLAVAYQLVSEYSSCVLVKQRADEEKADQAPELRKVPQMLTAGWGGLGSVMPAPPMRFSRQCLSDSYAFDMVDLCESYALAGDPGGTSAGRLIGELPDLPFSVLEVLKAQGIQTIQDLLEQTREDLQSLGLEEEDIELIIQALAKWRLELK